MNAIVREIQRQYPTNNWIALAALAVVSLLSVIFVAFLSSYMKERGSNLATKADLNELNLRLAKNTQIAEEIRATVATTAWKAQKQWEFKRDVYVSVLNCLGNWAAITAKAKTSLAVGDKETMRILIERRKEVDEELYKVQARSRLVLEKDAIEKTEQLFKAWQCNAEAGDSMNRFEQLEERIHCLAQDIAEIARKDLLEMM